MKIGYPCINWRIGCKTSSKFKLKNYSEDNLIKKIENNLYCLKKTLEFNIKNNLLFFRISSDTIPFASHPICQFNWANYFKEKFAEIGQLIKKNHLRISMHPDQFVLINSLDKEVIKKSIKELEYHCQILDLLHLDSTAKIQIHVGGVYGDKKRSIKRFVENYKKLDNKIKKRLVIENDERQYSLKDCLNIAKETNIPIVFDVFHHYLNNNGESIREGIILAQKTYQKKDGILIVDYSNQKKNARLGTHSDHIDVDLFKQFINETEGLDFDIMLEIKDKEKSALEAAQYLKKQKHKYFVFIN